MPTNCDAEFTETHFGAFELLFSIEFDGQRHKWVLIKIIGE